MNLLNILSAVTFIAIVSPLYYAQPNSNQIALLWGEPNQGVRMSLSLLEPQGVNSEIYIAFENIGERDTVLYLGDMLGNGARLLPQAIRLVVTDEHNRSTEFRFFNRRYPAAIGRLDPYLVPLRVGSIYTLKLNLGDFWLSGIDLQSYLSPGRYRISARFEGRGVGEQITADSTWVGMVRVWKGQLQTNEAEFVKQ
ncbi:MAG: hypothetical protein J2P31_05820 [Blastocatellia bacterium]|nr:hypothetical protein [Blastocatellia bacterium]